MRRLLFLLPGLLLIASCKEKSSLVDFGTKAPDTAFMAPVETAQARMVLFEEFTGVTCPNCPTGGLVIKSLDSSNPGRMAIIGIQIIGNTQTNPVDEHGVKTINDNRTQVGTDLSTIYGSNIALPQAGIDRVSQSGSMLLGRNSWPTVTGTRLTVPTKANVTLTNSYNASTRTATVKVHIAYTSPVTMNQSLTLALIESDVVDAQELPFGDTAPAAQNYVHQHVLRDILTLPTGSAILGDKPTKAAGQVYERVFVYTLPGKVLNPDNCAFVAFVSNNNGTDREVIQATEAKLK